MESRSLVALFALLAALTVAPVAQAKGLASHSVVYDVKAAPTEKEVYVEAQATFTLTKRCDGWSLGEIFQFGIDKGKGAPGHKGFTARADRVEERVTAQESLDGATLSYQTQLRQNARLTKATGKATLGAEPGKLTADLGFHKPIVQKFAQLAPEDPALARTLPKDMHASDNDFAKGRMWALLRRVPDFNETGDELWLMQESGAIVRQVIQRQGVKLLLEAREVTLFPAPTCQ